MIEYTVCEEEIEKSCYIMTAEGYFSRRMIQKLAPGKLSTSPTADSRLDCWRCMDRELKRRRYKPSARKVVRIPAGKKSVVLGVTGSIAAYKSAELASLLVKQGHEVFVVMTHDAAEFISPLTLQTLSKNPVMTSFFDEKESWRPGHIELAD